MPQTAIIAFNTFRKFFTYPTDVVTKSLFKAFPIVYCDEIISHAKGLYFFA